MGFSYIYQPNIIRRKTKKNGISTTSKKGSQKKQSESGKKIETWWISSRVYILAKMTLISVTALVLRGNSTCFTR